MLSVDVVWKHQQIDQFPGSKHTSHYPPLTPAIMPSRSNPNTPSALKRKTASVLKSKRRNTQRLAQNRITKPTPRTSQAIRKAAAPSKKKAHKLERKIGYARKRKMEEELGEVEMRDIENEGKNMRDKKTKEGTTEKGDETVKMDLDVGS